MIAPDAVARRLRAHPDVSGATVATLPEGGLRADVMLRRGRATTEERVVRGWTGVFDRLYDDRTPFAGWNSRVDGTALAETEMQAWRTSTLRRLRALPHTRVLEIGCGTGLIATGLAPHAARYVATDISGVAIAVLAGHRADDPALAHLQTLPLAAEALDEAPLGGPFDLVVLNSVAQYLASADALARVLRSCFRRLDAGGHVFVGDVRDLASQDALLAATVGARGGSWHSPDALRARIEQERLFERELLLARGFFASLARAEGASLAVLPKEAGCPRELLLHRYDVVLGRGAAAVPPPPEAAEPRDLANDPVRGLDRAHAASGLEHHLALAFGAAETARVLVLPYFDEDA